MIAGRWKHPNIVRARIEKDIKPAIGSLKVEDVKPRHIDDILKTVIKRGAPSISNDVLRWLKRIFNYAVKRHAIEYNPAAAFDPGDAGGKEKSRDRWLSSSELTQLFAATRDAIGFSIENGLSIKLLLLLAVRKSELIAARWSEFDLDKGYGTCQPSAPRLAQPSIYRCLMQLWSGYSNWSAWRVAASGYCRHARCRTACFRISQKVR